jgi:hypothetical protein
MAVRGIIYAGPQIVFAVMRPSSENFTCQKSLELLGLHVT